MKDKAQPNCESSASDSSTAVRGRSAKRKKLPKMTDSMAEYVAAGGPVEDGDKCDYCGRIFNPDAEGHTHEEGDCDCPSCQNKEWKASVIGKSYCSPECEMHDS